MKKFIALGVLLGLVIIGSAGADLLLTKTANTTVFSEVAVGGGGGDTFWGTNAIAAQSISNVFPGRVYINGTLNGVKVYRVSLTQSGTGAPVATVLENTLGGSVTWTRTSAGSYRGHAVGLFGAGKTLCLSRAGNSNLGLFFDFHDGGDSDNVLLFSSSFDPGGPSFVFSDDIGDVDLSVLVYP